MPGWQELLIHQVRATLAFLRPPTAGAGQRRGDARRAGSGHLRCAMVEVLQCAAGNGSWGCWHGGQLAHASNGSSSMHAPGGPAQKRLPHCSLLSYHLPALIAPLQLTAVPSPLLPCPVQMAARWSRQTRADRRGQTEQADEGSEDTQPGPTSAGEQAGWHGGAARGVPGQQARASSGRAHCKHWFTHVSCYDAACIFSTARSDCTHACSNTTPIATRLTPPLFSLALPSWRQAGAGGHPARANKCG